MTPLLSPAARALGWAIPLFLVLLSPALGSIGSIVASVAALLLIPIALDAEARRAIAKQPAVVSFGIVFLALAVSFAITARAPHDLAYAFNFLSLPLAAVVYAVARRVPDGRAAVRTMAILCLAGTLVCLAIAANDILLRQLPRLEARFMGPNTLARLALVFSFIALAGLFVTRSRWRLLYYLAPLAGLAAIYLSGTRAALLALPLQAVILLVALHADRRDRAQAWVLAGLVAAALVALIAGSDRFASAIEVFRNLAAGAPAADAAVNERLAMLAVAQQLFAASPIVGHGWGHFAALAYPLIGGVVWGGPDDPLFQFHNDLANFAVAAGVIGIACLVVLLAAPLAGALASGRDSLFRVRLYCCLELSAATAASGLTDFTLGYDLPTTLYVFLTAIVLGAFRAPQTPDG